MNKKPDVFIIDDDQMVLEALAASIASLGVEVSVFAKPAPCIRALKDRACSLLITDVNMPEMNGIDLLKRAKELQPLLPVLVVTGNGDIPLAVEAIRQGAVEFIEKPLDENTLLPAVKKHIKSFEVTDDLHGQSISDSERAVLKLVAEGKANKEIAHILDKSIRTIENQRHRLNKKLNITSTADMVKLAVKLGLVDLDD